MKIVTQILNYFFGETCASHNQVEKTIEQLIEEGELHNNGTCSLCNGNTGMDFDYCRACGFTLIPIRKKVVEEKDPFIRAINRARGGPKPPNDKGFA